MCSTSNIEREEGGLNSPFPCVTVCSTSNICMCGCSLNIFSCRLPREKRLLSREMTGTTSMLLTSMQCTVALLRTIAQEERTHKD